MDNEEQAVNANLLTTRQRPDASCLESEGIDVTTMTLLAQSPADLPRRQANHPLCLLEMPVDILNEIISHLPHANDLTALARSHSILHSLAIPSIYSRFDIIWPEQGMQSEARGGVDALTYGLATLVKSQEIFGEAAFQQSQRCTRSNRSMNTFQYLYPVRRRRLGNCYAQHTKKFSIGNGPSDCISEYLITKESGKMLGTLVALAVARMKNLEAFVWDMPTGILRDVWLALSALEDSGSEEEQKLDKLWVRWHNNWAIDSPVTTTQALTNVPPPSIGESQHAQSQVRQAIVLSAIHALSLAERVEHPSFSVVPPLKSLTVLEIDELVYLDELSILIARSSDKLRELRVGIAKHTREMDWTKNWEGSEYQQVDHSTTWTICSRIGEKRLHGVLGILLGRMHNLKHNAETVRMEMGIKYLAEVQERAPSEIGLVIPQEPPVSSDLAHVIESSRAGTQAHTTSLDSVLLITEGQMAPSGPSTVDDASTRSEKGNQITADDSVPSAVPAQSTFIKNLPFRPAEQLQTAPAPVHLNGPFLNGVLKLHVLELERVALSLPILKHAFDFTTITSLTLMNCQNHHKLWRDLRLRYAPTGQIKPRKYASLLHGRLNLRKIHTDTPSSEFLKFVREALRPNTLETLFLQDRCGVSVSVHAIFTSAVMRHRLSLRQLLIDSGQLDDQPNDASNDTRWRKWCLARNMVAYLTSGKLPRLRELAVNIEYADWHVFLQRLCRMPTLRSLNIAHVADHPGGPGFDTHELALQVVDIITLRPEIELCYMGLGQKCFEILESKRLTDRHERYSVSSDDSSRSRVQSRDDDDDDDIYESDAATDDGAISGSRHAGNRDDDTSTTTSSSESEHDDDTREHEAMFRLDRDIWRHDDDLLSESSAASSDADDNRQAETVHPLRRSRLARTPVMPRLRLQEILFYDKIAIFKARHGKL